MIDHKQYLVLSSPIVVGSFASINEAHEHIRARHKRNGFVIDFEVIDRFNEPGEVKPIVSDETGETMFYVWEAV